MHLTGGLGETRGQAQRRLGRPLERLVEQPVAADEQRGRMAAVAPPEHTGGHVQLREDTRAELLREPLRQRVVHSAHEFVEARPAAPGVAAARHGDGGGESGRQIVPHAVEDRGVQDVLGEHMVEGVAAQFVRRLQGRRGHHPPGSDRPGREEGAHHLRGEMHGPGPHPLRDGVAVGALGRDDQREERRRRPAAPQGDPVQRVHGQFQNAQPLRSVGEGQPYVQLAGRSLLHAEGVGAVGPARQRRLKVQVRLALDERHQQPLLDVDQVDRGRSQAHGLGVPVQDDGQFRGGRQLGRPDEFLQQEFPEPTDAFLSIRSRIPATAHRSRSKTARASSQCWVCGFFRSGWRILKLWARARLRPPMISG